MPTISKTQRDSSNGTPVAASGNTTVVAAPGAGLHLEVRYIAASTTDNTSVVVSWREGAAGNKNYPMRMNANTTYFERDILPIWKLASNTALVLNCDVLGSVNWAVDYEIVPD